jgi:endonuclease-3
VDTHCWRVCRRLGWIRATRRDGECGAGDMDRLQSKIPARVRFSLHVSLISLGRAVCTATAPKCPACPIRRLCRRQGVTAAA